MHILPRLRHWRRLARLPFALELTMALALKMLVLWLLWHLCFSAPQTHRMRLPAAQVEQHLLAVPSPLTTGIRHDLR